VPEWGRDSRVFCQVKNDESSSSSLLTRSITVWFSFFGSAKERMKV
jgi:hypothetical protein